MIKKYQPINLFPIYKKVSKKNSVFNYFRQNKHFTDCQLLSITHEIYERFDCSPTRDINGIFLNISNVFVKIWHKSLLFNASTKRCFKCTKFIVAKCNIGISQDPVLGIPSPSKHLLITHHVSQKSISKPALIFSLIKTWKQFANKLLSGECYL